MLIRFRNRKTRTVVRVDGVTAERLSPREWERLSAAPAPSLDPVPSAEPVESVPEPLVPVSEGAPAGNASRGEWATYASSLGFEVDGLKRDEIRDLVAGTRSKGAADLEGEDVSGD